MKKLKKVFKFYFILTNFTPVRFFPHRPIDFNVRKI